MKVLLVNGSSHAQGTTMRALEEMIGVFEAEGVETEVIQLGGKPLADCLQCNACAKSGKCVFADDGVNEFVEKAREADGFVFATPVYYAHPSGRIFSFLDRAFYSNGRAGMPDAFRFKPGASVAVARRGGISASFDALNKYFADARGRLHLLEHGAWRRRRGRAAGRGGHADAAQPRPQHDLDDALLRRGQGAGRALSRDGEEGIDQLRAPLE